MIATAAVPSYSLREHCGPRAAAPANTSPLLRRIRGRIVGLLSDEADGLRYLVQPRGDDKQVIEVRPLTDGAGQLERLIGVEVLALTIQRGGLAIACEVMRVTDGDLEGRDTWFPVWAAESRLRAALGCDRAEEIGDCDVDDGVPF